MLSGEPIGKEDKKLKKGIHPEYKPTTITCACGSVIETRSTAQNIRVEICSSCHPFFTGKQKLVDSGGRVERFRTKYKDYDKMTNAARGESDSSPAKEHATEK